jgi:biopolymer transport protein ExbB/TolQ
LGTIFGLIAAFSSVAAASAAARQEALAAGISQAMYTTAFGISVAVPLLFFHHVLSKRMEKILIETEGGASALLVALTGVVRELRSPGSKSAPHNSAQPDGTVEPPNQQAG